MNYLQKNKSHLIFQDEQKDYRPGNCGWEIVSGIEKFDAYSFPSLRPGIRIVWEVSELLFSEVAPISKQSPITPRKSKEYFYFFFPEWMLIWLRILHWSHWSKWNHSLCPGGWKGLSLHTICNGPRHLRDGHGYYFQRHELPGSLPNAPAKHTQNPGPQFKSIWIHTHQKENKKKTTKKKS